MTMEDFTERKAHENVYAHFKGPKLIHSASIDSATLQEDIYNGPQQHLKSMYTFLKEEEMKKKLTSPCAVNVNDSNTKVYDLAKVKAKLNVTIRIIFSEENYLNLWSKTEKGVSKYHKKNNNREISEIGHVFGVSKYINNGEMNWCPCKKCQHSEKPSKDWGKVRILMARFLKNKNIEPTITSCEILGEIPVTLNEVVLRKSNDEDDWQELECVTCDIELLENLENSIKKCSDLWKQLHGKLKKLKEIEGYEASLFLLYNDGDLISERDIEDNKRGRQNDVSFQSHGLFRNCFSFERFSIFISSVSLLLAIVTLIVVCVMINKAKDLSTNVTSAKENVCLSCTDSSLAGNIDEIVKLLEEFTRPTQSPRQNEVPPVHKITHTPSSAHLYLREPPKIAGTDGDYGPNFSNKDHVDAHLQTPSGHPSDGQHARGVHVSDTGIYILYSGLYYIYSGVSFKTNTSKSSSEFAYQNWFHYVHRISPNSPMNSGVLLRNVYTACPSCNHIGESGFTGGIFNLQAGDKIQVCFSGQGFIDYESNTSFLGLFMLSSPQDHHLDVGV